jgi:hypothetical protein
MDLLKGAGKGDSAVISISQDRSDRHSETSKCCGCEARKNWFFTFSRIVVVLVTMRLSNVALGQTRVPCSQLILLRLAAPPLALPV